MDTWITDTHPKTRFVYFTRANADEVGPEPFSPLGWSLGWVQGAGKGAADGFVNFGICRKEELAPDYQIFGNWGGYFYNNLGLSRLMGVRMPGVDVDAIDKAYFGNHPGVPPYVPDPQDVDPVCSEKLTRTLEKVMASEAWEAMLEGITLSRKVREARPDYAELSDQELVSHARKMVEYIRQVWAAYCEVVLAASIGPGVVDALCDSVGRRSDAVKLFAGIGDVESAGGVLAVWRLSRRVRHSQELTEVFDMNVGETMEWLESHPTPEIKKFLDELGIMLNEFGHRGPNEWDLRSHSWSTNPNIVLGVIERLRMQSDDSDPLRAAANAAEERQRIVADITAELGHDMTAKATFLAGLESGTYFYRLREAGKNAIIRIFYEAKTPLFELSRRMTERGVLDDMQQIFMLLDTELDEFVAEPAGWRDRILDRSAEFEILQQRDPPYIVDARQGPPLINQWPVKNENGTRSSVVGDVLRGAAGAPGRAVGRVRIVLDPATADIDPGDVLVCRTTDPAWVPLFLVASAVVCDVGAIGSHASIVARELGLPCAVSVIDATKRLSDGMTVMVDGNNGEVQVLKKE